MINYIKQRQDLLCRYLVSFISINHFSFLGQVESLDFFRRDPKYTIIISTDSINYLQY